MSDEIDDRFWPPRVVWAHELGWVNVRDPWGEWHSIPIRDAPKGYGHIASLAKDVERARRAGYGRPID